jgi:DNA-binding LacI/PurR family transcriptional regulator
MDDIARLANVSKPTVSRALRGSPLVTEETKQKVLAVARAEGYAVNRQAQKLRAARSNTIAVVMDFGSFRRQRVSDPFMYELLAGVSEALALRGLDLLLQHSSLPDAQAYVELVNSKGVDGFIVLGQGLREGVLREAARAGAPLVVWGAALPDLPYVTVGSDNHRGGWLAGRHLVAQGRRRILFAGNAEHAEIRLRLEGLCDAVRESGAEVAVRPVETFSFDASVEAASAALAAGRAPDGVFAQSDTAAMAFAAVFREAGLCAPDHYSLVGYNDIPTSAHHQPPLTTVRQDTLSAGRQLVAKLGQVLAGETPKPVVLPTELIVRAS